MNLIPCSASSSTPLLTCGPTQPFKRQAFNKPGGAQLVHVNQKPWHCWKSQCKAQSRVTFATVDNSPIKHLLFKPDTQSKSTRHTDTLQTAPLCGYDRNECNGLRLCGLIVMSKQNVCICYWIPVNTGNYIRAGWAPTGSWTAVGNSCHGGCRNNRVPLTSVARGRRGFTTCHDWTWD